ncbi:MAG: hypothetical protein K9J30_02855 [Bacteroidales bacterium]|nr:hypothetical protein [Bacteroidales bacterium]
MKNLVIISGIVVALLVLFTACEKGETNEPELEGVYQGTLTSVTKKSDNGISDQIDATSEISITGENEIQVHCYADGFDTTYIMNYYQHYESVFVCNTGSFFEEIYGHMLGAGHMGGMMDDMHDGETEWMHHMDEEHDEDDEHFGGFDMANNSFSYTFQMNRNDSSDDLHFQGIKQ